MHALVFGIHAVDLAKEQRRETMAVHRPVRFLGGEQAGFGGVLDDKIEGFGNFLAIRAAPGQVAVGHVRQPTQRGDADVLAVTTAAE